MAKLAVPKKSCVTERHRSQSGLIVVCFSRSMNGSGSRPEQLAERAQELGRGVQADRRLQVGPLERLAEHAAELAVHADVDVGVDELRHVGEVAAEREHHVDLGADALDQAADLGEVGRHVEGAVDRPDDVDARLRARRRAASRSARDPSSGRTRSTASTSRGRRSATGPRRWCAAGSAGCWCLPASRRRRSSRRSSR